MIWPDLHHMWGSHYGRHQTPSPRYSLWNRSLWCYSYSNNHVSLKAGLLPSHLYHRVTSWVIPGGSRLIIALWIWTCRNACPVKKELTDKFMSKKGYLYVIRLLWSEYKVAFQHICTRVGTHTVSMVTELCSEILVCVNDSPGHTGEDVKNSLAVIYCGAMQAGTRPKDSHCGTHAHKHSHNKVLFKNERRGRVLKQTAQIVNKICPFVSQIAEPHFVNWTNN